MHNQDFLAVVDDPPDAGAASDPEACWTLLIVDDDEDVHHATEFALGDLRVMGRPLEFLHAFSADEAIRILEQRRDVAVVLLDVVMEGEDAGLKAVEYIRNELRLRALRIILRTGQPGYAPELEAIANFDINDYKTKTELTRGKLFTTIMAAVRSFEQIRRLEASRSGLELIIAGVSGFNAEQGLQVFASAVIAQLAALLGVPADGIFCLRSESDQACAGSGAAEQTAVLAATGRYLLTANKPLAALPDPQVVQVVESCLRERRSQHNGHSLALYFSGRQGGDFAVYIELTAALPDIESHLLDVFCSNVAICSENVRLVERLRTAAYVNDLTRLPNRVAQIEEIDRLGKVSRSPDRVLGLIDIDEFSETIDAFGYLFGDRQLQAVAARLRAALPADAHLARVGGDIFGVYGSRDVVNPASLRSILLDPFENEAGPHTISFSIGFASSAEADDRGAELLRNAAIALKRAKLAGPGNDAYYTAEVGMLTRQRVHLLHDLRAALDNDQLFVVYQPQFDLASGAICGVEALVRWRSGTGEAVPLDQFIPVAEQSGLIVDLGDWVLRMALAAQRELADHGYPLRMAVNVSPVQFRHHAFLRMVRAAVAEAAIDARFLELEITESVALFGWAQTVERMRAIKALGASIAIDDFGTGFSSLSYLARLPTDCLKIDRSFVTALGNRHSGTPIAELVVQLGKQLGMRVLAEGVENPRQLQILRSLGCHEGQGMVFALPMDQDDLLHWLRGREP